mgnify:CR=1 FL=1
MTIRSTNAAEPAVIQWKGESLPTGIFKKSRPEGIYLSPEGVRGDTIGNPKVHGDALKAAYLFASGEYPYWKSLYPSLDWEMGMFGENLTVEGLDEGGLVMGSTYRIGEALVRITTPREPCYKLGIRFQDQDIIEKFVDRERPGTYVSVLEAGPIKPGDPMQLVETGEHPLSIRDYYRMWYARDKDPGALSLALKMAWLPASTRQQLQKWQA